MEKPASKSPPRSRKQLLDMLKLEEATVAAHGFPPSPDAPHHYLQPFRDSITCLEFSQESLEPCDMCWLMHYVQQEKQGDVLPCHLIPLNTKGETVASLTATGDHDRVQQTVLSWLRAEIAKLEKEIKQSEEKDK